MSQENGVKKNGNGATGTDPKPPKVDPPSGRRTMDASLKPLELTIPIGPQRTAYVTLPQPLSKNEMKMLTESLKLWETTLTANNTASQKDDEPDA